MFFFVNATATTEIYTLSTRRSSDLLRLRGSRPRRAGAPRPPPRGRVPAAPARHSPPRWRSRRDRKSTRLNSSHGSISYAVFCLKKKKKQKHTYITKQIHMKRRHNDN